MSGGGFDCLVLTADGRELVAEVLAARIGGVELYTERRGA